MAVDIYTRASATKAKRTSRIITLAGGRYAVAGVPGVYSTEQAEALARRMGDRE
jgi:hypothetical protein